MLPSQEPLRYRPELLQVTLMLLEHQKRLSWWQLVCNIDRQAPSAHAFCLMCLEQLHFTALI